MLQSGFGVFDHYTSLLPVSAVRSTSKVVHLRPGTYADPINHALTLKSGTLHTEHEAGTNIG